MFSIKLVLLTFILFLLSGCGGSDNSNPPPKTENPPVASLALDTNEVQLFTSFDNGRKATIKVTYQGDTVSVAYPDGETPLAGLGWTLREIDKNTSELTITEVSPGIPDGDKPIPVNLRVSTGTPGSNFYASKTINVTVTPRIPLALTAIAGQETIRGELGHDEIPAQYLLSAETQSWRATADVAGVLISPAWGMGSRQLSISLSGPVDTDLIKVTVDAGDRKITMDVPVDITMSTFTDLPTEVSFLKQKQGIHAPVQIPIALLNNGIVGWKADFPEWLLSSNIPNSFPIRLPGETGVVITIPVVGALSDTAAGVTNGEALELFVNHKFPFVEGVYEGVINLNQSSAGKPLTQKIKVKLPFEKHRIHSNQSAFSFSDYGVSAEHRGSFSLNELSPAFPGGVLKDVVATASEPWVNIEFKETTINFNLQTSSLVEGFHVAEIRVESKYPNIFVGDTIRIGYYKTNAIMPTGRVANLPISTDVQMVSDKLGPWVYYVDKGAITSPLKIIKYNLFTHQVDNTFSIPDAIFLSTLVVSDDGATMYARDDKKVLHKIDLMGNGDITSIQTESEGTSVHQQLTYARVNGKSLLLTHDNGKGADGIVIDVETGKKIYSGKNFTKVVARPQGDMVFIASQWTKSDFSYINQALELSSSTSLHGFSLLSGADVGPIVIANNGKELALVDYASSDGIAHLYRDEIWDWDLEALQLYPVAELENLESYPFTRVNSIGQLAYIADYINNDDEAVMDQIVVTDESANNTITYPLLKPSEQFLPAWFSLSADEKFITYLVKDGSDTVLYVQPMR